MGPHGTPVAHFLPLGFPTDIASSGRIRCRAGPFLPSGGGPNGRYEAGPDQSMSFLVFDFDSTLVSVEGLDELFARTLDGAPDREERIAAFREVTDRGMAGEIAADESLRRRIAILNADRSLVDDVGREISGKLTPSVERNLPFFRDNADRILVLSGGFEELILPTMGRMGLPPSQLQAHRFRFSPEGKVEGIDPETALATGGKPEALRRLGRQVDPIWAIGDGATDLELKLVGLADRFVAFTENRHRDPVVARADSVARSMDELIELLENS